MTLWKSARVCILLALLSGCGDGRTVTNAQDQTNKEVLSAYDAKIENENQFRTVFDFIRATDAEEKWRQIAWIPSLWSGLQIADQRQKPVFIWAMNGDPLGCV